MKLINKKTLILLLVLAISQLSYITSLSTENRMKRRRVTDEKKDDTKESEKKFVWTTDDQNPLFPKSRWLVLFKNWQRPTELCSGSANMKPVNKTRDIPETDWLNDRLPTRKANPYKKEEHGRELSAYLFDWIDGFLMEDVVKEFKKIVDESKKIAQDPLCEDVYSTVNQIEAYKSMGKGQEINISVTDDADKEKKLLEHLAKLNPNVIESEFQSSINICQMSAMIKTWKWQRDDDVVKWQKKLLDAFDFNGDGRLNAEETLTLAIIYNYTKGTLGEPQGENTFNSVCKEKVDGIFNFADCNGDGYVSAEELWHTFKYLKKAKDQDKYNMYKCDAYVPMTTEYNSGAINDLILKNNIVSEGLLNNEEFRVGILLGFLERQVLKTTVFEDNSLTEISGRWGSDGKTDIRCKNIKDTLSRTKNTGIRGIGGKL
jgi:hypothetical protein